MSVHKTTTGAWRVRWRDETGRNRSKVLGRKRDAEAFDAEVRRRKRTGDLATFDAGRETLAEFARRWWLDYAEPNLAPATLESYARTWDLHVLPRLGDYQVRDVTLQVCQRFAADLAREGVGPATHHRALVLLGSVMQRAVDWQRITMNPVRAVRKPVQRREREVRPLAPASVEALRAVLGPRDATLVSVLACVGPRPGEALQLRWQDVGDRSVAFRATKTRSRRVRAARLMAPVGADLMAWRLSAGRRRTGRWSSPVGTASRGRPTTGATGATGRSLLRRGPADPSRRPTVRPAPFGRQPLAHEGAASSRWRSGWGTRRP